MIPASYLFRSAYKLAWEDADMALPPVKSHRFMDGLMTPFLAAMKALIHREPQCEGCYHRQART